MPLHRMFLPFFVGFRLPAQRVLFADRAEWVFLQPFSHAFGVECVFAFELHATVSFFEFAVADYTFLCLFSPWVLGDSESSCLKALDLLWGETALPSVLMPACQQLDQCLELTNHIHLSLHIHFWPHASSFSFKHVEQHHGQVRIGPTLHSSPSFYDSGTGLIMLFNQREWILSVAFLASCFPMKAPIRMRVQFCQSLPITTERTWYSFLLFNRFKFFAHWVAHARREYSR